MRSPIAASSAAFDLWIERFEQLPAGVGHEAQHLSPVRETSFATNEVGALELVEQARDRRAFLDHPLADRERRDSAGAGAANYPKRIVLGETQTSRLDDACERSIHDRRRAEQCDRGLLCDRTKRLGLPDLALNRLGLVRGCFVVAMGSNERVNCLSNTCYDNYCRSNVKPPQSRRAFRRATSFMDAALRRHRFETPGSPWVED